MIYLRMFINLQIIKVFLIALTILPVLCCARDDKNITSLHPVKNESTLLKDKKVLLNEENTESALTAIRKDDSYFIPLFSNGSVYSDIGQKVSREQIPIREIVLQPDGVTLGGNSPRISGRQLVDIIVKAKDGMLTTVPVKNGSIQRDSEDKIKILNGNKTKVVSIIEENFADFKKVNTINSTKMGSDERDKFFDSSMKRKSAVSADEAYFLTPLPLISDDCNEMKTNLLKNTSNVSEKDMEFSEKDMNASKKRSFANIMRAMLVPNSKSISHVHGYDKSRRAIQDDKVKFNTPKGKMEININKNVSQVRSGEYEMENIPFEREFNSTIKSITSLSIYSETIPMERVSKSVNKSKHDNVSMSFDYLKRKIISNTNVEVTDDNVNSVDDLESDFKTSNPPGIDEDIDSAIVAPGGLNVSSKKMNKDEKWSAWHERERDRDTVIRYSVGLSREKFITPTLGLSEGMFLFRFLSRFFTILHPFDFPTELLRDVIWNTISVPQLILQSIRVEVGFIIAIIIALIIALVVPAYGLCCALLRIVGGISKNDRETSSPPPGMVNEGSGPCEKRICLFLMLILVLFSSLGVTTMVLGNESAFSSASLVRDFLSAAMRDIPTYAQAAHQSMSHVLLHGADQTISALEHDLNRVDILLGEPIQTALSAETGVDVALDALTDIATVSNSLSEKVLALGAYGSRAAALAATAKERLNDLKRQADTAKRHCGLRDRPLCETSDTTGLELVMQFEMVTESEMEPLAVVLNAKNLTEAVNKAKEQFNTIPKSIANQTSSIIEDIRNALHTKRLQLQISERSLAKAALHITTEVTRTGRHVENIVRSIDAIEFWRWTVFLVAVLLICFVVIVHIVAIFCGCCGVENYAGALSKTSVVLMCLFSIPLWLLAIVVFVAGGHGEVFMCRPLYNEPSYVVLGKLLDKPGLLYNDGSGFFQELFEELNNITINVPIAEALRECKHNRPAYPVFHLREILDMNAATAHYNWTALHGVAERMSQTAPAPASQISVPNAYEELRNVMKASNMINFTDCRLKMNGQLTGKDLNALADQFESIANQISDLTTSSRIETLASRTRRLYVNTIQPLDQLRTELVFRLTELELQVQPFHKQMNQSLSHLKTIQYYIDNQGAIIAEKKVQNYVNRLRGYLEQYRGHVLNQMENHVAPCGPLWDVYDAGSLLLCRHYVDSLNGFWFGLACCLLIWTMAAPLSLRLRRACRAARDRKEGLLLRTISHQSSSENAAISDQSTWATPGEQNSDHWR